MGNLVGIQYKGSSQCLPTVDWPSVSISQPRGTPGKMNLNSKRFKTTSIAWELATLLGWVGIVALIRVFRLLVPDTTTSRSIILKIRPVEAVNSCGYKRS